MKKRTAKKLVLSLETLRGLDSGNLETVAGGGNTNTNCLTCWFTCDGFTCDSVPCTDGC